MNDRPIRAAQYVRMSTEHQQYSTENQAEVLQIYALQRGIEIVRTFSDAGKSGLRLQGRDGLIALIETVIHGSPDFTDLLVYDVSRWGRFQDADESAHYEFLVKEAGITVHYCAEQFVNDGSPMTAMIKSVKRSMAGEYSRELSAKVFKGQCKLVELGFRQGGAAGYGLRRLLIDQLGKPKAELQPGEQKSLQTDRVVLVPGPPEERAVVRRIYRLFVHEDRSEGEIAAELTSHGMYSEGGREWTRGMIRQVLTNEKYVGNNVYNRISYKLKKKRVRNPPEMWVRRDAAFEAIIDDQDFAAAQMIILQRHIHVSDSDLLDRLRELAKQNGKLSGLLIDETDGMPSSATYRQRFGSLARAYELVEYFPDRDYAFIEINKRLRALYPSLVEATIRALEEHGGVVVQDDKTDLLVINGMLAVSIVIARCQTTAADSLRWMIKLDAGLSPDLTIVVRMDPSNQVPIDYYVLPSIDVSAARLRIKEDNGLFLDAYRYESLEYFFGMAQTIRVGGAA